MAYGSVFAGPSATTLNPLPVLAYRLPTTTTSVSSKLHRSLYTIALNRQDGSLSNDLMSYLHEMFNTELATGKTYPQEGPMSLQEFEGYYCAATVVVGVIVDEEQQGDEEGGNDRGSKEDPATTGFTPPREVDVAAHMTGRVGAGAEKAQGDGGAFIETLRKGRSWKDCIGGCYYIKPNYPGRSSHNAGFLIPPHQRGLKLGLTLGRSYLVYAPLLGYRGSVFNLVYKNNLASLAIWDRLGFSRVGLIPKAGRLRTGPDGEEEYVDAVVVFKSFV